MRRYAAFLRGINAGVNARMEDLRRVFEGLGFTNVQTVISSGNVLFMTNSVDVISLEQIIESALDRELSPRPSVNIRTEDELKALAASQPFKDVVFTPKTKPYVTFLKKEPTGNLKLPLRQPEKGYAILKISDRAIISVVDLASGTTPDLIAMLDKKFGKEITTRSWNTIERVLRKWNDQDLSHNGRRLLRGSS